MPSPLAHASLVLLIHPLLRSRGSAALPVRKRRALSVLAVVALCMPDVDLLLRLATDRPAMLDHGGITHSLAFALGAAVLFTVAARWALRIRLPLWTLGLIGAACCISHAVMDAFTPGRGVMLLWPMTELRFVSPVPLFFGVEHSQPLAWHLHSITLATELLFVLGVWLVARLFDRRVRVRMVAEPERREVQTVRGGSPS